MLDCIHFWVHGDWTNLTVIMTTNRGLSCFSIQSCMMYSKKMNYPQDDCKLLSILSTYSFGVLISATNYAFVRIIHTEVKLVVREMCRIDKARSLFTRVSIGNMTHHMKH